MKTVSIVAVVILASFGTLYGDRHIGPDMDSIEPAATANFYDEYMFLSHVEQDDDDNPVPMVSLVNEHGKLLDSVETRAQIVDLVVIHDGSVGNPMAAGLEAVNRTIIEFEATSDEELAATADTNFIPDPTSVDDALESMAVTSGGTYVCGQPNGGNQSVLYYREAGTTIWNYDFMTVDGNPVFCHDINADVARHDEIKGAFGPPGPDVIGMFSQDGAGAFYTTLGGYIDDRYRVVAANDQVYAVGESAFVSDQRDLVGFDPHGSQITLIEEVGFKHLSNYVTDRPLVFDLQMVTGTGETTLETGEAGTNRSLDVHVLQFGHNID